jgi:hypothetical protein
MPDNQPPTPPSPTLKLLPEAVELSSYDVQAFSVSNSGLVVEWSIQPPGVGHIDAHGIYHAPEKVPNPRSVVVLAKTPGGAQYGTATVTLSDAPRAVKLLGWYAIAVAVFLGLALVVFWRLLNVVREPMVVIDPPEITIDPEQAQDIVFDAIVLGDLKNGVTWSASDGNIDISKGIYKRPKKSLTKTDGEDVTITATSLSDQNVRNTAELHLRTGQQLLVHPSAVSVFTSQQVRFRAEQTERAEPLTQAPDKDKAIRWRLDQKDLGEIDEATGVYTAPRYVDRTEPFEVVAESASGARSAAVITVNPAFGKTDWKLIVFVIVMGSLGSMIYFSSSFVAYVGNRSFRASWLWFYISRPFVGGGLAVIFFLIVGGGFLNNRSTSNLMAIGVIAALVGLFSDRAVKKLSDIFDVVFAVKDDRGDKLKDGKAGDDQVGARSDAGKQVQGASPKITSTEPPGVTKNQPTTLTVHGSNFNNYKIQINDDPPIDPSNPTHETFGLSLTAAQTKGDKVTITVINGDKTTTKFDVTTAAGGPNGARQSLGSTGPAGPKPQITASVPTTLTKNQATSLTVQGSNFKNYKVKINGESAAPLESKPDSFKVQLTAEQTKGDKVTVTVVNEDASETRFDVQTTKV